MSGRLIPESGTISGTRGEASFSSRPVEREVAVGEEKHPDTYVAYPIGLKGVVIGQGATYEEALDDVRSAIAFHIETFGSSEFEQDNPVVEAFIAETCVAV